MCLCCERVLVSIFKMFIYCAALWSVVLFYEKQWLRYVTVQYGVELISTVRYGMNFFSALLPNLTLCSVFKKMFLFREKKTFTSDSCDL